ncbi:MAG: rhomboid family intramembrane serine protease, partial [Verrucomicrobiae bacterium]|nr:rhomboid family intramembrane serine protease [Verrucomicrobiae bacterium]
MLSDRDYMRDPYYGPNHLRPLYWLLGSIVAAFVVQMLVLRLAPRYYYSFYHFTALSANGIQSGFLWTFITYSFLHATEGSFMLLHILFNCLMIFWMGRILLPLLGTQRFFTLYGLSVLLGGVAWFVANFWKPIPGGVIGASGGVMGLLIAFALHFPRQPIQVLLFFIIPVRLTPMTLVKILLIVDGLGFLFNEVLGKGLPVAHSAHLGGALGGWVFVKFLLNKDFSFSRPDIKPPNWFKSRKTSNAQTGRFTINFTNRRELQKEVDRILDKITHSGFGSLTEEERHTLDKAKEMLNR